MPKAYRPDLDKDLWKKVKMLCAQETLTIKDLLETLLEEWVEKMNKTKKTKKEG